MRFGSVCSGIEAASVAWEPLGWQAAWFSEIEPFPSAVLAHHYLETTNLGDMTRIPALLEAGEVEAPDIFCGGTPCQAFSVAGLRRSLDDARGNLSLTFCEIANAIDHVRRDRGDQPCVVFWENVPGVLSTKDNAFGCFLAGLAGEDVPLDPPGGKWADAGVVLGPARAVAWRILDAQYFGLAQRRRRVFVVASARADFDPAAVLLEWEGLRRDSAPSREAGQRATGSLTARAGRNLGQANDDVDGHKLITMAHGQGGAEIGFDRGPTLTCNHEAPIVAQPVTYDLFNVTAPINRQNRQPGDPRHTLARANAEHAAVVQAPVLAPTLTASNDPSRSPQSSEITAQVAAVVQATAIAFSSKDHGADATADLAPTLRAMNHADSHANGGGQMAVACIHADAIGRTGTAVTPSADAEGRVRLRDPGMGVAADGTSYNLMASGQPHGVVAPAAVAYTTKLHNTASNNAGKLFEERTTCLDANSPPPALLTAMQVRRLTPRECERLQGFPDDYTAIPWRGKPASECPDGPRYKALGNSWAVPVVRWIGARIHAAIASKVPA